jgi:predicted nucleic acid-binding protein
MRVVSNPSPRSNLAIIGRLDLLKQRYGMVQIPPVVAQEPAILIMAKALGKQVVSPPPQAFKWSDQLA